MTNELPKVANGPKIIKIRTSNGAFKLNQATERVYEYVYIRVTCKYDFIMLLLFLTFCSYVRIVSAFRPLPFAEIIAARVKSYKENEWKWFSSQPLVAEAAFGPTTRRSHRWFTRTVSSPWDLLRNRGSLRHRKLQKELEKHLTISMHISDWKVFTHTANFADYWKLQDACRGVIPQTCIMACLNLNIIRIKLLYE